MAHQLRLGSRKSSLALKQAEMVKAKLLAENPNLDILIMGISTQGDIDKTSPLSEIGGKGVFIKTIEEALLNNEIDMAVHSLKDVTSECPKELELVSFLNPEAVEDVLIVNPKHGARSLEDLPKNAVIGTGSLRRKGLLKEYHPDLKTIELRGNIETRIQKCMDGECDAILLSKAGLIRMGWVSKIAATLEPSQFVTAPGQGVIAIQVRKDNTLANNYAALINHPHRSYIAKLELHILYTLGLDCRFPFGLYTQCVGDRISLTAFWADPELKHRHKETLHFLKSTQAKVVPNLIEKISEHLVQWGVHG